MAPIRNPTSLLVKEMKHSHKQQQQSPYKIL